MDPEGQHAHVLVPPDQLSLAIGREGQNVRLAARLTGWKIDIKNTQEYEINLDQGYLITPSDKNSFNKIPGIKLIH